MQLQEFKKRRQQINERNQKFKLLKLNQKNNSNGPVLAKLDTVNTELDLINRKCVKQLTEVQRSSNYGKTAQLMKNLTNQTEKKSAVIEIVGDLNHKFRNAVQTKMDTVFEKLEKVTERVGLPQTFKNYNFLLDGLDVDVATDQIREHFAYFDDSRSEVLEKRLKPLKEKLKYLQDKLNHLLAEDFEKIDQKTISNVSFEN